MVNDKPTNTAPAQEVQPGAPAQPSTPTRQADPGQSGQPFVHPSLGTLRIKGTEPVSAIRANDQDVKHG